MSKKASLNRILSNPSIVVFVSSSLLTLQLLGYFVFGIKHYSIFLSVSLVITTGWVISSWLKSKDYLFLTGEVRGNFNHYINQIQEPVIRCDLNGKMLEVNYPWCDLVGMTKFALLNRNFLDFIHPSCHTLIKKAFSNFKQGVVANQLSFKIIVNGAEQTYLNGSFLLQKNRFYKNSVVAVLKDITKEKRLKGQLTQAHTLLREAKAAKSDFLANISHELRTPMNGLLGNAELLLESDLDFKQKEAIYSIHQCCEDLLMVVDDLLTYSRLEDGNYKVDLVSFDLREALSEVVEWVASREEDKQLELIYDFPWDLPSYIEGDKILIKQLIFHLIQNSVKFTEKGYVSLRIRALQLKENFVEYAFQIQDTGCGITDEKRNKIFDQFTQADSSSTRKVGGMGLGLSIVKKLVQCLHGTVKFRSAPGVGTVFEILIRFRLLQDLKKKKLPELSIDGLRILVIDDNKINLNLVKDQLTQWNSKVEIKLTNSPSQGLKILKKYGRLNCPFQITLIDYLMPEMDGCELAKMMHLDPEVPDTYKILLTSSGEINSAAEMVKIGFDGFLIKPIRYKELINSIVIIWNAHQKKEKIELLTRNVLEEFEENEANLINEQNKNVLLVEDNPINLNLAKKLLEKLGCEVAIAKNGIMAVQQAQKIQFQIIFMDCQMPEMDGFEATIKIRDKNSINNSTPIVALTANTTSMDKKKCYESGMNDFLPKPVKFKELKNVLYKFNDPSSVP